MRGARASWLPGAWLRGLLRGKVLLHGWCVAHSVECMDCMLYAGVARGPAVLQRTAPCFAAQPALQGAHLLSLLTLPSPSLIPVLLLPLAYACYLFYMYCIQVAPVIELLQATQARYHELLSAQLQGQVAAVVEADVLSELEIRSEAQHAATVAEYGLPWQLEGAGGCS